MAATTLVLAAAVLATAGQSSAQNRPAPADPRSGRVPPPAFEEESQEPAQLGPRQTCRMPVLRGNAKVDSRFVLTPDGRSGDRLQYSVRRAPSTHVQCPDPLHREEPD
jgi:hypothetical protein